MFNGGLTQYLISISVYSGLSVIMDYNVWVSIGVCWIPWFSCVHGSILLSTCVLLIAGFNPVWEETLSFTLHMPEIALVRFLVWDHDPIGRDFVGQRTVAFSSLMPGERRECKPFRHQGDNTNTSWYSYLGRWIGREWYKWAIIPFTWEKQNPTGYETMGKTVNGLWGHGGVCERRNRTSDTTR